MESIQNIKRRLKGVGNINQITKAMELVAATKMRRSQEAALASRPYALAALDFLAHLTRFESGKTPALLETRAVKKTAVVVVASDKGLAGSFNSEVLRAFEHFLKTNSIDYKNPSYVFFAVGQKVNDYLRKRVPVVKSFTRFGDFTTIPQIKPLAQTLIEGFLKKDWDKVLVFSTHFQTALRQKTLLREVLPATYEGLEATAKEIIPEHGRFAELVKEKQISFFNDKSRKTFDYLVEPSPTAALETLIPHLITMQIYHLILEANASEHAARRVAMKNASDNASDLAQELTIEYNKSRQASITRELLEITAGAESLHN